MALYFNKIIALLLLINLVIITVMPNTALGVLDKKVCNKKCNKDCVAMKKYSVKDCKTACTQICIDLSKPDPFRDGKSIVGGFSGLIGGFFGCNFRSHP